MARLTYPVVVHSYNMKTLTERMERGEVLFIQRAGSAGRLRAITHVVMHTYTPTSNDCIIRHGNKYTIPKVPLPNTEDVPLPVQIIDGVVLCFGDRIRRNRDRVLLDPLRCVSWPVLNIGDTVLVTPKDGDWWSDSFRWTKASGSV